MSYVRWDDELWRDALVAKLLNEPRGLEAFGLYALAYSWAGDALSDGFVPTKQLLRIMGADATDLATMLVDVGLWKQADGGYAFPRYLEHNDSRETVQANRLRERHRMHRLRGKPCSTCEQTGERTDVQPANEPENVDDAFNDPTPTPTPTPSPSTNTPSALPAREEFPLKELQEWLTTNGVEWTPNGHIRMLNAVVRRHGPDDVLETLTNLLKDGTSDLRGLAFECDDVYRVRRVTPEAPPKPPSIRVIYEVDEDGNEIAVPVRVPPSSETSFPNV